MKDLRLEIDAAGIAEQKIKERNCYHFRSAAIIGFNDLIFRKRLLNSSWQFRKKILQELKNYLVKGVKFQAYETDRDIASLKRDFTLLFGSKADLKARLTLESKYLPPDQTPKHHELYAVITELSELYQNMSLPSTVSDPFEESAVSSRAKELLESFDYLETNTPKLTSSWLVCNIQNGKKLGRDFAASSETNANKFFEEVEMAIEKDKSGDELPSSLIGFRALGFLDPDPQLFTAKSIKQERDLVLQILRATKLKEAELENTEDKPVNPNAQDHVDTILAEKEASL